MCTSRIVIWADPLSHRVYLISFQPVLHDWCNKGRGMCYPVCGMCYPVCGMMHIKEPLLLISISSNLEQVFRGPVGRCKATTLSFHKHTYIHTYIHIYVYHTHTHTHTKERKCFFYLTTHSTHFIYGYMASDIIMVKTTQIAREETRCRHIGCSYRLTARVLLYAPSHRQDNTYHSLCYTSHGALAGTRNSSMGPPHEGSIRRPIAQWANALTRRYTHTHKVHSGQIYSALSKWLIFPSSDWAVSH